MRFRGPNRRANGDNLGWTGCKGARARRDNNYELLMALPPQMPFARAGIHVGGRGGTPSGLAFRTGGEKDEPLLNPVHVPRHSARVTRNGHDWSDRYPSIVGAAVNLPCQSAIVDGEAIVEDDNGAFDFEARGSAMRQRPDSIILSALTAVLVGSGVKLKPRDEGANGASECEPGIGRGRDLARSLELTGLKHRSSKRNAPVRRPGRVCRRKR